MTGEHRIEVGNASRTQLLDGGTGWPTYHHRMLHETVDVTPLVRSGANAQAVRAAGCWFTEHYSFHGQGQPVFGTQPAFAARLDLILADGTRQTLLTDADWRVDGGGPLTSSGLYGGVAWDARLERHGWDQPGFDDSGWLPAEVRGDVVRRIEEVAVESVLTSPSGGAILDFGQNLVGRLRIHVRVLQH